mgnify:CR=1 FL=1
MGDGVKITINSNQLPAFLEVAKRNGTVDAWCEMALECIRAAGTIMAEQTVEAGRLRSDRDALLALAKQYAGECSECGGTGVLHDNSYVYPCQQAGGPCPDCADIRAVIAKAEGRA